MVSLGTESEHSTLGQEDKSTKDTKSGPCCLYVNNPTGDETREGILTKGKKNTTKKIIRHHYDDVTTMKGESEINLYSKKTTTTIILNHESL